MKGTPSRRPPPRSRRNRTSSLPMAKCGSTSSWIVDALSHDDFLRVRSDGKRAHAEGAQQRGTTRLTAQKGSYRADSATRAASQNSFS